MGNINNPVAVLQRMGYSKKINTLAMGGSRFGSCIGGGRNRKYTGDAAGAGVTTACIFNERKNGHC